MLSLTRLIQPFRPMQPIDSTEPMEQQRVQAIALLRAETNQEKTLRLGPNVQQE